MEERATAGPSPLTRFGPGVADALEHGMMHAKDDDGAARGPADSACARLGAVLDLLSLGIILIDERMKVVFVNRCAATILAARDGLMESGERLSTASIRETSTLNEYLSNAAADHEGAEPAGAMTVSRSASRRPLSLLVTSARSRTMPAEARMPVPTGAVVFIADADRPIGIHPEVLARLYDLTPAEAILAEGLANGRDLNSLSGELGVSRNTLRSQLQSVFSKTHTNRQAELVKMILTGPAVVGGNGL